MPNKIIISKKEIEQLIEQNLNLIQIANKLNICKETARKRLKEYGLKTRAPQICLPETKIILSEKRKKFLAENPDKHPWRKSNKFKSQPCEKVKEFLRLLGIEFISEFQPNIQNRNFSIDIALPDKMIALEINGNQHYNRDGTLKPYYAERQTLLEQAGWIVYQIHYSACFNLEKWSNFINNIKNSPIKTEFNYFNYVPRPKKSKKNLCKCGQQKWATSITCINCARKSLPKNNKKNYITSKKKKRLGICECGAYKTKKSIRCRNCNNKLEKINRRVVCRPPKEKLEKLIWETPMSQIAKSLGVSDNAVKKWCKLYGITSFPGRGYWQKLKIGTP